MDEFKVLIQAIVDAKDLQSRLDAIKDLSVKVEKVNLDPSAIDSLKTQLNKNGIDVNLVLGNTNQIQNQAKQTGRQIGKLISDSSEKAINAVTSKNLGKYFRIDPSTSREFETEMKNLVKQWTDSKGQMTDLKIDTKTVYDKDANASFERLHQATVTYKNDLDEITKKTIAWRQVGTTTDTKGNEVAIRGFVEVAGQYSKALEKASIASDTFADKQTKLKASLSDSLNSIKSSVADQKSSKPIKDQANISSLQSQYKIVEQAISNVGSASKSNFAQMEADARTQISVLNDMVRQYRNAENVATSLRTKDFTTVKGEQTYNLQAFKDKIKGSNVPIEKMQEELKLLDTALDNAFDSASLTSYLNQMDIANAKFKQLNIEIESANRKEKVNINVSGLTSKIEDIQRISPEINNFKTQISGAEVSVKNLLEELSKVNSQGDLSVVNARFKAFTDSAKAAGIAITEVAAKNKIADQLKIDQTIIRLNEQLRKNTAYSKEAKNKIRAWLDELENGNIAESQLKKINSEARQLHSKMASMNKVGFSWTDKLKNAWSKFGGWSFATGTFMAGVHQTTEAIRELKEIDSILTEISKTSDRTQDSLTKLGISAVDSANKYGATISGYLKGVQEMSRAGFNDKQAEQLAELSILAQSAGDMDADLSNDYLIASDAAYGYAGNVEKLTGLLDGQNQITNRNAVSMEELANATKVAANQLSNMGIEENELTALLGTGIATSREAGETVGRAVKGIMMNLQQVAGETGFDGEVIDEESLKKVEARCHSVGVELEYMKDGIARLRDPMDVLKELAEVYNSLPENSADKAGIISDIGGKYRGNVLSSILSNWDKYEKMLSDYENAEGSALEEAIKTANSWEGLLAQISNNWTGFMQNFAEDGLVTNTLKVINGLVKGADSLVESFGALPTISVGIGALFGSSQYNPDYQQKNITQFLQGSGKSYCYS